MKRSTIATLATIAGVALVGGGAYAVTQIPGDEPAASATTEPGVIESPAASGDESSTPIPAESAGPAPVETEPAVEYTESQQAFIHVTQTGDLANLELTAEAILDAGEIACSTASSDEFAASGTIPGATTAQAKQFWINAEYHVCG